MNHLTASWAALASWQGQPVAVFGRPFLLGDVLGGKWYHGTKADLPVGTILVPGKDQNFVESATDAVSITSDLDRAHYWAEQVGGSHVYEVEPLGEVDAWRLGMANFGKNIVAYEARVPEARIIRVIA